MTLSLPQPTVDQISLEGVLGALGDPIRLAIVRELALNGGTPLACGSFQAFGSKTNLSYHLGKLRDAGVTRTQAAGTARLITLRREDLDRKFPGLLDSIVAAASVSEKSASLPA